MRYAAAVLGLLGACASESVEIEFDPCSPLAIVPVTEASPAELEGLEQAVAAWRAVLPVQIEVGPAHDGVAALPIRFESGDAFFRAMYWDARGEIWVGRDELAIEHYPIAIAHELGHAFGLLHVPAEERASVMNVGNVELAPTADDAQLVLTRWPTCAR